MARIAVCLFNLGGPDRLEAVEPFLFNLFNDPAILSLPQPFRRMLAWFIAKRRVPIAKEIYKKIGGSSPLLEETRAQSHALDIELQDRFPQDSFRTFIIMRYWHPMAKDVAQEIHQFAPDKVIYLPLYPQFSTTTTASSFAQMDQFLSTTEREKKTTVCCYPVLPGLIEAYCAFARPHIEEAKKYGRPRILFSAHGLPQKVIAQRKDPYQYHCEKTAQALRLAISPVLATSGEPCDDSDMINTYQSKVGPLEWIKPSTEDEIRRAGKEKRPLVIIPIAFVSEHSETLVELDIEYRELADASGVPYYARVQALGCAPQFISGLADLVAQAYAAPAALSCPHRFCHNEWLACPCVMPTKGL